MKHWTFLESVARAYLTKYTDLSNFCFVFPNIRSGSFFLKNLSNHLGERVMLAPEVLDIASFVTKVSGFDLATRIDLLFRLYKIYASHTGKSTELSDDKAVVEFDRFAPWGDVVINDFSEVEKYDVEAKSLFKNVRDFRDLSSNFLTEKQLEVIERYFGYRPAWSDVEGFWKSLNDSSDNSRIKKKFVELWQLLPELFYKLVGELEKEGLGMEGTLFRKAMQRIESEGADALEWDHVVFVGFNMLSTTEARIFSELSKYEDSNGDSYAEFLWDATGPVLGKDSESKGPATKAIRLNIKNFPMPAWALPFISKSDVTEMTPSVTISAAPSNSAQVKIAGETVAEWLKSIPKEKMAEARAAIVLPDENLLMPLLHSLPEELKAVNLTMGYSIKYTSIASFVYHLRRLQQRRRKQNSETGYYFEDIKLLLSHPLIHILIGTDKTNIINSEIGTKHIRVVTPSWLKTHSEKLAELLTPLPAESTVDEAVEYLDNVLVALDKALGGNQTGLRTLNTRLERTQIGVYRMALSRILQSVRHHGIKMGSRTLFHLVDKLVGGEQVTFKGEPLMGLQVMGMLETRALDFDYVLILSMNDKVMPRRSQKRTFIPDSLRRSYVLPLSSQPEELYSYYFYRLLSRAESVNLVYDARAGEGMRSGGKSRFLLQLEMLYARNLIRKKNYTFELNTSINNPKPVEKTEAVRKKLAEFCDAENGRNLSASALMNYAACQVKFYYKNVAQLTDDNEPEDFINAANQGNIVHEAMLKLYFPQDKRGKYLKAGKRIELTSDKLTEILNDREAIERAVKRAVNHHHYKIDKTDPDRELTGTVAMVAERLADQIESVIRHDISISPITLVGGELEGITRFKLGRAPEINIRSALDRVDIVNGTLRIVDYKTGKAHVEARTFDDIFNGNYDSKYTIQLMLYSLLLEDRMSKEKESVPEDISMLIYDVNTISSGAVAPKIGRQSITSHKELREEFVARLEDLICEIFDRDKPFEPTADEKNCEFCNLKAYCGKR